MSEHPDVKAAREQGYAEGMRKERDRCQAIVESPEAGFRDAQALHLATKTDMTVEAARKHLATLPADPQPQSSASGDERSRGAAAFASAKGRTSAPAAEVQKPAPASAEPAKRIVEDSAEQQRREGEDAFKRARGR